jgi:thiamine-phosphate pyrophosphorylase
MKNEKNMRGVYLVTPDWDDTDRLLIVTEQALQAGVCLLQYRHKTANADLRFVQATALQKLCRQYKVPFIINDHIDLCLAIDADGVHVGGKDVTVKQARDLVGNQKIVGASCYGDLELAINAQASGASYVAFGGFYPSLVKQYPVTTQMSIITDAKQKLTLPVVVIGGMTLELATPLVNLGTDMVAAISYIYLAENPHLATQNLAQLFI